MIQVLRVLSPSLSLCPGECWPRDANFLIAKKLGFFQRVYHSDDTLSKSPAIPVEVAGQSWLSKELKD